MANFDRYMNSTGDEGFTSVVFGADAPLLEVELNEMQEIQKGILKTFIKSFVGEGVSGLDDIHGTEIMSSSGTLVSKITIPSGTIFYIDGIVIVCPEIELKGPFNNVILYLLAWEEEVTKESLLKKGGYDEGLSIDNPIQDDRYVSETSRRKVLKYTFSTEKNSSKKCLPLFECIFGKIYPLCKEINFSKLSQHVEASMYQDESFLLSNKIFGIDVNCATGEVKRVGFSRNFLEGDDFSNNINVYRDRVLCNITNDGTVVCRQGDACFTPLGKLSDDVTVGSSTFSAGTDVQIMVWQPKFYYKIVPFFSTKYNNTKGSLHFLILISSHKISDFKLHPAFKSGDKELGGYFIGEYLSALQISTTKAFYSGSNSMIPNDILNNCMPCSSMCGVTSLALQTTPIFPVTAEKGLEVDKFFAACKRRGDGFIPLDMTILSSERMLYFVEYASTKGFVKGYSRNASLKQTPIVANSLGVKSGVSTTVNTKNISGGDLVLKNVPVYRGVFEAWGNLEVFIAGVYQSSGTVYFQDDIESLDDFDSYKPLFYVVPEQLLGIQTDEELDYMFIPFHGGISVDNTLFEIKRSSSTSSNRRYLTHGKGFRSNVSATGMFQTNVENDMRKFYAYDAGYRLCYKGNYNDPACKLIRTAM